MNTPHTLLTKKEDIRAWLLEHGVSDYELVESREFGWVVNSDKSVYLADTPIKKIEVKFNLVKGHFDCSNSQLTSLWGGPEIVGKDMDCAMNELESLEHCPQRIKHGFYADGNNLADILHFPQEVLRTVQMRDNPRLGNLQDITDYKTLYNIHLQNKIAFLEKEMIENRLNLFSPIVNSAGDKFKV